LRREENVAQGAPADTTWNSILESEEIPANETDHSPGEAVIGFASNDMSAALRRTWTATQPGRCPKHESRTVRTLTQP